MSDLQTVPVHGHKGCRDDNNGHVWIVETWCCDNSQGLQRRMSSWTENPRRTWLHRWETSVVSCVLRAEIAWAMSSEKLLSWRVVQWEVNIPYGTIELMSSCQLAERVTNHIYGMHKDIMFAILILLDPKGLMSGLNISEETHLVIWENWTLWHTFTDIVSFVPRT